MDTSPTDVTVLSEIDMNRDPSTFVGTAGKLNDTLKGAQLMSPPPSRKTKNRSTSSSSRGGALGGAASATPVNAALSDPSIRGSTLVDPSPARRDAAAILKNMFSSTQVGGFGSLMSAESSYIQPSSSYIQPSSSYLQPPPSSYTASTTATTATAAAITTSSTRGAGKRKEKRVSKKQSAGAKKSHTQVSNGRAGWRIDCRKESYFNRPDSVNLLHSPPPVANPFSPLSSLLFSSPRSSKNINSRQGAGGQPYSRKSKSLGLLCTSFIEFYSRPESPAISIDYSATLLGVERRRIYDIINILESVCVVKRRCKNTYDWCGTGGLRDVFRKLMWEGIVEGVEGKDAKWKVRMGNA